MQPPLSESYSNRHTVLNFDRRYPTVADLRLRAQKRIPRFAFEYLDGGCNAEVNLARNTSDLHKVQLRPHYFNQTTEVDLSVRLFGKQYAAPFGVAPVGLQGLIYPRATEILAAAAKKANIPFVLSTVATSSIENIAEITEGDAWFQLYHPVEQSLTDDILRRLRVSGIDTLVLLCDVPTFGYRANDIKNGLAMPPTFNIRNVWDSMIRPTWSLAILLSGLPHFATLKPYIPNQSNMKQLGAFMNSTFNGVMTKEKIARLRDAWQGTLVMKGIANVEDAALAHELGIDGVVVSNHGGRQLDAGESSINVLKSITQAYKGKITLMMDSGIRSGSDVACALATGAEGVLCGRAFMYAVAALGSAGGDHAVNMLTTELRQVLEQLRCQTPTDLPNFLVE